jgi:O-antigen/teichoic acid export membrane protein
VSTATLTERIARGLKASLLAEGVYMIANAALVVLLTRFLLDPSSYGLLNFAISVLGVIQLFGSLGLAKSGARYVTEYLEEDKTQVRGIIRTAFQYNVVAIALTVGGLLVFREPIAELVGEPDLVPLLIVGAGYIAFYSLRGYVRAMFQAFNRVSWSAVVRATESVTRVVFAAAFVLLGLEALGALLGYVAGAALGSLVGAVVLYWRFYRVQPETETVEPGLRRRILEYSFPLTLTKASVVLDSRIDTILVGALLNTTAVGYYALASQIADFIIVPATSLGYTISPTFGEQKASDQLKQAARTYETALRHILLIYIPAGIGLVLVAEPTIEYVFSDEYLEAAPLVQVFGIYIVVRAVHKITGDGLDYIGRASDRARARMVTAAANFGLNLLLIPTIGILGAALATIVTYSTYTLLNVYYLFRELPLDVGRLLYTTGAACVLSVPMAGVVLVTRPLISGIPSLLAVIFAGASVWALLAVLSGLLDTELILDQLT